MRHAPFVPHFSGGALRIRARVSTRSQADDSQLDALTAASCERIWTDTTSGKLARRPEWDKCLDYLRSGDELVITRLSRMARSVRHLTELAALLGEREVDLVVLQTRNRHHHHHHRAVPIPRHRRDGRDARQPHQRRHTRRPRSHPSSRSHRRAQTQTQHPPDRRHPADVRRERLRREPSYTVAEIAETFHVSKWPGLLLLLLGAATTALLLGLSGFAGLPLPLWVDVVLIAVSGPGSSGSSRANGTRATRWWTCRCCARRRCRSGCSGRCAYLVLFGPLTLFPQVLGTHGLATGFVLTALPTGFTITAVAADRLEPRKWSTGPRAFIGALTCLAATGMLMAAPTAPVWVAGWLLGLGLGLGMFIPANNTTIMGAIPAALSGTRGGLVNMSRGLGTALGVAVVTLSLHLAHHRSGPGSRSPGWPCLGSAPL